MTPSSSLQYNQQLHIIAISLVIILSALHFVIIQADFDGKDLFVNLALIASISATLFTLAVIFKRYDGARNIRTAYLYLFISYVAYLQGEITWFGYESILGIYPYPSIADIGFFFYYVFTTIFLISIVRCHTKLTRYDVGHAMIIISIITSVYMVLNIEAEVEQYDLVYALPFILASSSVFAFSITAVMKLRKTSIALPWIIIFVSMLITTIADIWYYNLENLGAYTYDHVINTLWITSDAVLIYALILHRRIL